MRIQYLNSTKASAGVSKVKCTLRVTHRAAWKAGSYLACSNHHITRELPQQLTNTSSAAGCGMYSLSRLSLFRMTCYQSPRVWSRSEWVATPVLCPSAILALAIDYYCGLDRLAFISKNYCYGLINAKFCKKKILGLQNLASIRPVSNPTARYFDCGSQASAVTGD